MDSFQDNFDYLSDQKQVITDLNSIMADLGMEFVFMDGDDPATVVICCAHKEIVLECDVLYGHHNQLGLFVVDKERFKASPFLNM